MADALLNTVMALAKAQIDTGQASGRAFLIDAYHLIGATHGVSFYRDIIKAQGLDPESYGSHALDDLCGNVGEVWQPAVNGMHMLLGVVDPEFDHEGLAALIYGFRTGYLAAQSGQPAAPAEPDPGVAYASDVVTGFDTVIRKVAARRGHIDVEAIVVASRTTLVLALASAGTRGLTYATAYVERMIAEMPDEVADAIAYVEAQHPAADRAAAAPH